jgi:transaldolase
MAENRILKLIKHGQSYWLDNLSRRKIRGGELRERVEQEGLRGVTTNPTILNAAISTSDDYDREIGELRGLPPSAVYESLAVNDVREACDILRPVYDVSHGIDGYVSLEVSPHLAFNTEGTAAEARRLYLAVDRPNCLIKIPATDEGIPAIAQLICEGLNINVTLIFSIPQYERVAGAYIAGLERRAAAGLPLAPVRSVASFFLSRIDGVVDEAIRQLPAAAGGQPQRPVPGATAVANAKLAYRSFIAIFGTDRWRRLEALGARVQRPLWASTGTKDRSQSDVKYVEPLIGRETVTTLPESTIAAFADHGVAADQTVTHGLDEAERQMELLAVAGIELGDVAGRLLSDGVRRFQEDYDKMLKSLRKP